MKNLRPAISLLLILTFLLGGAYPLAVTAVAQILFHHKANGSLIEKDGKVIGSALLGQQFTDSKYFWGRLSATTPPYNAAASAASNLSPANPELLKAVNGRIAALHKADPGNQALIPVDLVTSSASGLDPDISLDAAYYQLARVAKARGMKEDAVKALVERHIHKPLFGLLGEPYVNAVELNLALDEHSASGIQHSGK